MTQRNRLLLGVLALLVVGCASTRPNPALKSIDVKSGYRFQPPSAPGNSEKLFVILSFSGGGTRAAALSYGALEELKRTTIRVNGETRRLLDEVDIISSVSGGSFTAAYYGLYGDRIFEDFETRFLKRNIQGELVRRFLAPWNWPRLWSSRFDRIDLAAEVYDRRVFDRQTFQGLIEQNRTPLIVLNATDISSVSRFEFTQDQFDLLCSDLAGYPIARAVAASSSVPLVLTPITIKAYPRSCGYKEPIWLSNVRDERQDGSRRFYNAQRVDAYLDPQVQYVHLVDGGLSDNIGLRGPLQLLFSADSPRSAVERGHEDSDRSILQKINLKKIDTLLVIAVNSRTSSRSQMGEHRNAPKILGALGSVTGGPMGNYSYETIELLKESMRQWTTDIEQREECKKLFRDNCPEGEMPQELLRFFQKVAYYPVELNFNSIADKTKRERLQSLPTTFTLRPDQVDELESTASELLQQNPEFQRFLTDFKPPG